MKAFIEIAGYAELICYIKMSFWDTFLASNLTILPTLSVFTPKLGIKFSCLVELFSRL